MDKHENQDPKTNRRSKHAFKACTARPDLYRQPRRICVVAQGTGCCLRQSRNNLRSHDIPHPTSPRLKWSAPAVIGVIQVRKGCYTTYRPRLLCILSIGFFGGDKRLQDAVPRNKPHSICAAFVHLHSHLPKKNPVRALAPTPQDSSYARVI